MPKRVAFNRQRLEQILRAQHYVISRQQAISCQIPSRTLDRWVAPGHRWQRVLPGVYAAVTGKLAPEQRLMAAMLYAGPDAVITAWFDDAGVAAEVDSRAYHISPADQDRDAARHDKLVALGVLLQHFSPRRVKVDGRGVIADLSGAIVAGRNRPRLPIIALSQDATWDDAARELPTAASRR